MLRLDMYTHLDYVKTGHVYTFKIELSLTVFVLILYFYGIKTRTSNFVCWDLKQIKLLAF